MSDAIEQARRCYDIHPDMEFNSVMEVIDWGQKSNMADAYHPDVLTLVLAQERDQLQDRNDALVEALEGVVQETIADGHISWKELAHRLDNIRRCARKAIKGEQE